LRETFTDKQLFDQSGGAASGGKQDVINSAAGTIIKLMLKQQMSGVSSPLFHSVAQNCADGLDDGWKFRWWRWWYGFFDEHGTSTLLSLRVMLMGIGWKVHVNA